MDNDGWLRLFCPSKGYVKIIENHLLPGWWFGTFFIFPYIGNNHPNWLIFFRGVDTTNQWFELWESCRSLVGAFDAVCVTWSQPHREISNQGPTMVTIHLVSWINFKVPWWLMTHLHVYHSFSHHFSAICLPFFAARPDGWRPVVHVLSGSRVGALLEVSNGGNAEENPARWVCLKI